MRLRSSGWRDEGKTSPTSCHCACGGRATSQNRDGTHQIATGLNSKQKEALGKDHLPTMKELLPQTGEEWGSSLPRGRTQPTSRKRDVADIGAQTSTTFPIGTLEEEEIIPAASHALIKDPIEQTHTSYVRGSIFYLFIFPLCFIVTDLICNFRCT